MSTLLVLGEGIMYETRGIWVDKRQLLEGEEYIEDLFAKLKEANFNAVNLCTYFQGHVIYPDSEFLLQHPEYTEKDYLDMAINLARKYDLEVYAWMEWGFYGYHAPDITKSDTLGPIFDKHPNWLSIDRHGNYFIRNPQWGDFVPMSPVNYDAQDFLIDIHVETIKKYPFDGIDLDRIRYGTGDFCFSDPVRILFLRDTGIDIREMEKGSAEEALFTEWKQAKLNFFVEKLATALRDTRPDIRITSAVAPPYRIDELGQDWPTWAEYGWVDGLSPMLYGRDIGDQAERAQDLVPENFAMLYGLSCDNEPEVLEQQIRKVRELGAKGVVLWYAGTVEKHLDHLKNTVFSEPAKDATTPGEIGPDYTMPELKLEDVEPREIIPVETREPGQE